jgi:hypothetical protein
VHGKFSFSIDAVGQFYANNTDNFLANKYYGECSLGYALKGANNLPLHYINIGIIPIGYYYDFDQFRVLGKLGLYTGIPMSTLRYTLESNVDVGVSCGAAVEYHLLSAGLTFEHGFAQVAKSPIKLYNWGLMIHLTCKILSFNN